MNSDRIRLHVIEKSRSMRPETPGSSVWRSGDWTISEARAARLVGATIHFHEKRRDPSYFGGTIMNFQVQPEGHVNAGQVVFIFERQRDAIGLVAGPEGWKMEQKVVGLPAHELRDVPMALQTLAPEDFPYKKVFDALVRTAFAEAALDEDALHEALRPYRQQGAVWDAEGQADAGAACTPLAPGTDADFWRILVEVVFYSGVDAAMITARLPVVMHHLSHQPTVAAFPPNQLNVILADQGMVRNRKKVQACIDNARTWNTLVATHGSFAGYLRSFGALDSDAEIQSLAIDLVRHFAFIGEITVFHFLMEIGLPVVKPDRVMQRVFHRWGLVGRPRMSGRALRQHLWQVIQVARRFSAATQRTLREVDILVMAFGQRKMLDLGVQGICLEQDPRCEICQVRPHCRYFAGRGPAEPAALASASMEGEPGCP